MNEKDKIELEIKHLQREMLNYFRKHWKLFLAEGILFILLGVCALLIPQFFTAAIVIFLGWLLLIGGVMQIVRALAISGMPGSGAWLFLGILQALAGYLFIARPAAGVLTLTLLVAMYFGFEGIAKISVALMMRPLANWGWILFSGITALIFALIISISWSETSQWLLGLFLGINMIFLGWSLVRISLHHKEN